MPGQEQEQDCWWGCGSCCVRYDGKHENCADEAVAVAEVVLDVHDLGVSRVDLLEAAYTGQELVVDPQAGKALELVGAAAASARASCSKACDPGHLLNECLVVDKGLHWRGADSVECGDEYSPGRLEWQRASPWLAMQGELWPGHSLSKVSC